MNIAIDADKISLFFKTTSFQHRTLRDWLISLYKKEVRQKGIQALKDISFKLEKGGSLGILGKNGAGKSTLLRVFANIYQPDSGTLHTKGRVCALLELGAGFVPDFSGSENVYIKGVLLGLSRKKINKIYDRIVDFAELEDFMSLPVKFYSTGMRSRLAFAIATEIECEILLIDEVLAVGDIEFKEKCRTRMESMVHKGVSLVLVSHNMLDLSRMCERSILLESGKIKYEGDTADTLRYYNPVVPLSKDKLKTLWVAGPEIYKEELIWILKVELKAKKAERLAKAVFDCYDNLELEIKYEIKKSVQSLNLAVSMFKNDLNIYNSFDVDTNPDLLKGRSPGKYIATVPLLSPMKPGEYDLSVTAGITSHYTIIKIEKQISFYIRDIDLNALYRSISENRQGVIGTNIYWNTKKINS